MAATAKTYFHRTPGASFFMPDGRQLNFNPDNGHYTTEDEAVQKELDKIANVPTSHIYTTEQPVATAEERQVVSEIAQQATTASDAVNRTPPGTRTIPMPVPAAAKPTLAGSPVAAAAVPAETAAKLAAARAAVAKPQGGKPV